MRVFCIICNVSIYGDAKIDSFYAPKDIHLITVCNECRKRLASLLSGQHNEVIMKYLDFSRFHLLTPSRCMICDKLATSGDHFCDECIKGKILPKVNVIRKMLALEKL